MKHFEYISKHDDRVKLAYKKINAMLNELHKRIKSFTFTTEIIGSYKRNLITYDIKSNIGFDFDYNIVLNQNADKYSPKKIKESIFMVQFKELANKYGFDKIENSTRVITLKKVNKEESKITYSCDFAIVRNYEDDNKNKYQEYIRFNKNTNRYLWYEQSYGVYDLPKRIDWIKHENNSRVWDELKNKYLHKKNINNDTKLHSRQILSMAVNDICNKYGYNEVDCFENEEKQQTSRSIHMDMICINGLKMIQASRPIKIDSKFFR